MYTAFGWPQYHLQVMYEHIYSKYFISYGLTCTICGHLKTGTMQNDSERYRENLTIHVSGNKI